MSIGRGRASAATVSVRSGGTFFNLCHDQLTDWIFNMANTKQCGIIYTTAPLIPEGVCRPAGYSEKDATNRPQQLLSTEAYGVDGTARGGVESVSRQKAAKHVPQSAILGNCPRFRPATPFWLSGPVRSLSWPVLPLGVPVAARGQPLAALIRRINPYDTRN